ncbi:MAG: YitT family protein [Brotaphodocola sp.]
MALSSIEDKTKRAFVEYSLITMSMIVMTIGVYFFKFPNHFSFGGVTGFSPLVSRLTGWSASSFTFVLNNLLLILGFLFLGRDVGLKTVYATLIMSFGLSFLEKICPMTAPITEEPLLELVFAIFLPAVGSAVLFNIGASSGGTDIIAMIVKAHSSLDIGTALFVVDITSVLLSFFVFGPTTGLFSALGLLAKSLVIDSVIENINKCKCFNIICDDPDPICEYIIHDLHRGATVYEAKGAFSHHTKTIILTTMKRGQAMRLRTFIKHTEPSAFILISDSSEIIGKGFLTN